MRFIDFLNFILIFLSRSFGRFSYGEIQLSVYMVALIASEVALSIPTIPDSSVLQLKPILLLIVMGVVILSI